MQDQRIRTHETSDEDVDQEILSLLMIDSPGPWSVDEISCALGNAIAAHDGVSRLAAAGLVHRLDRFVFPTRAAVRAREIAA